VSVIPNGVNEELFRPDDRRRREIRDAYRLGASDLVALFVGGDWDWKGLSSAIRGVAVTPGYHLLVVGSGDVERYEEIAQDAGALRRIHFAGPQKATAPYYAAADVFLFPSSYEACPLVVLEAAAAGLPLLVTRVSGVAEVLTDEENGWFVEPDPQLIASRLEELRNHIDLRKRMGARSRRAIANHTWSAAVEAYLSIYRELRGASAESTDLCAAPASASR
jgi:UDP-glucose:(heptosyl)LPS alpha-1,3-glucosyltransferase